MPRYSALSSKLPARAVRRVSRPEHENDRLAEIDATLDAIQATLDVQFKRMAALQAELDLLKLKKQ